MTERATTRKAVLADAAAACDVVRRSIVELCVDDHHNDPETLAEWLENKTPAHFERWIESDRHAAIVAEFGDSIAGFGLLNLSGNISLLYVSPDARFQGVSRALLAAIEAEAARLGLEALTLDSSKTALRFYRSAGYSLADECSPGFGVTVCHPMSRKLPA